MICGIYNQIGFCAPSFYITSANEIWMKISGTTVFLVGDLSVILIEVHHHHHHYYYHHHYHYHYYDYIYHCPNHYHRRNHYHHYHNYYHLYGYFRKYRHLRYHHFYKSHHYPHSPHQHCLLLLLISLSSFHHCHYTPNTKLCTG